MSWLSKGACHGKAQIANCATANKARYVELFFMRMYLSRLANHSVPVVLITGQRVSMSPKAAWQMFFTMDGIIFLGAAFCLVVFLFPVPTGITIHWWMKLSGFAIFMALIPVIYFLQALLAAALSRKIPSLCIFEPILIFTTAFALESVDHVISPVLFGNEWARWHQATSFGEQVMVDFLMLLALDVLFSYFVVPRFHSEAEANIEQNTKRYELPREVSVLAEALAEDERNEPDQEPTFTASSNPKPYEPDTTNRGSVDLDGQDVPIADIMAVEAEEHYVRVWTEDREIYARHAFGGLISRMGYSVGFSPRRGIWLSFRNIESIQKDGSGKFIIMPYKGPLTVVPKAKAREVRVMLKQRML